MLEKIVSGGQTGVDRAALDTALALDIPCGGWCPRGRRAADGEIPSAYPLQETGSSDYSARTRMNVRDSDGTLVLNRGPLTGGTGYTVEIARALHRPYLVCDPRQSQDASRARHWLEENRVRILNIAGPRDQERSGIYREARDWLEAFCQLSFVVDVADDPSDP